MIASLGMYDRPECRGATDRLWGLIRDGLRAGGILAPEHLTRGDAAYWPAWQDPTLVLSQTCGSPYRTALHGHVTLIGTPDYALPGCAPGFYNSVFVARKSDARQGLGAFDGASFAYNDTLSQSGWCAPMTHTAGLGLHLKPVLETGAHAASARAVAEGAADLAALDAQTWRLIMRHDPSLAAQLREVARTAPTPGLPLIAGPRADVAATRAAVVAALANLAAQDREALDLRGLILLSDEAYLAVPNVPAPDQIAQRK